MGCIPCGRPPDMVARSWPTSELPLDGERGACKLRLTIKSDGNRPPGEGRVGRTGDWPVVCSFMDWLAEKGTASASSSSSPPSELAERALPALVLLTLACRRTKALRSSPLFSVKALMSSNQATMVSYVSARNTQVWPRCMDPAWRPLITNLCEELPGWEREPSFWSGRYRDMTGGCV